MAQMAKPAAVEAELAGVLDSIRNVCLSHVAAKDAELRAYHHRVMNEHLKEACTLKKPLHVLETLMDAGANDCALVVRHLLTASPVLSNEEWRAAERWTQGHTNADFVELAKAVLALPAHAFNLRTYTWVEDMWIRRLGQVDFEQLIPELAAQGVCTPLRTHLLGDNPWHCSEAVLNDALARAIQGKYICTCMTLVEAGATHISDLLGLSSTYEDSLQVYDLLACGAVPTSAHLEVFIQSNCALERALKNWAQQTDAQRNKVCTSRVVGMVQRFIECKMNAPKPGTLAHLLVMHLRPTLVKRSPLLVGWFYELVDRAASAEAKETQQLMPKAPDATPVEESATPKDADGSDPFVIVPKAHAEERDGNTTR